MSQQVNPFLAGPPPSIDGGVIEGNFTKVEPQQAQAEAQAQPVQQVQQEAPQPAVHQQTVQQPAQQQVVQQTQSQPPATFVQQHPAANKQVRTPDGKAVSVPQTPSAMSSEVTLDDDVSFQDLERFPKMNAGETRRLFFPVGPRFKQFQSYWFEEHRFGFVAPLDNPELMTELIKNFGAPKVRFLGLVGVYDTDAKGNVRSTDIKFYAYPIGTDKFPALKKIHEEWDLNDKDFLQTCTEAEFQKSTYTIARESLINQIPEIKRAALERGQYLWETAMEYHMGRKAGEQEIRQKLFGQAPQAAAVAAGYNPFNPASRGAAVGTGAASATTNFADLVAQQSQAQ